MTDQILIPPADAVITPVLEKMYEKRPSAFKYLNLRSGVYWHPVFGFRAQAARMIQRLALLAAARTLKTAEGQELLDYVASEFEVVPETDKTFAEGTVTIGRSDLTKPLPGGTFPKGTRILRSAFTALSVSVPAAEYELLAAAVIDVGSTGTVTVPVRATRVGAHANTPTLLTNTQFGITLPGLVQNVAVTDFQTGGGSDGPDDDFVRLFARTFALGQYGPTSAASKLGALSATGVRHMLVFDTVATGTQTVLVADKSWGSSERWAGLVQQSMYDADLVGFGCKIAFARVRNRVISVTASVNLRDANYLKETTDIDVAIQDALRSYFDDRTDWNVWNTDALKSVITRAHPKVFGCSSVAVLDAATASPLSEIISPDYTTEQVHLMLASNGTKLTYLGPS